MIRRFDEAADLGHLSRVLLRKSRLVRLAAFARPEARAFGILAGRVELHVRGLRQPRRTRRPAIDARRAHGIDERAVGARIARDNGPPPRVLVGRSIGPNHLSCHSRSSLGSSCAPSSYRNRRLRPHSASCFQNRTKIGRALSILRRFVRHISREISQREAGHVQADYRRGCECGCRPDDGRELDLLRCRTARTCPLRGAARRRPPGRRAWLDRRHFRLTDPSRRTWPRSSAPPNWRTGSRTWRRPSVTRVCRSDRKDPRDRASRRAVSWPDIPASRSPSR